MRIDNYLLMNMVIADALYAAFVTPKTFLTIIATHPEGIAGSVLRKIITSGNLAWIPATSSVFTWVAIAAEKYFAVICLTGNLGKLTKRKLTVSHLQISIIAISIYQVSIYFFLSFFPFFTHSDGLFNLGIHRHL